MKIGLTFLRGRTCPRTILPTNMFPQRQGQLIDAGALHYSLRCRGGRFEIRSAGPDRKLWTDDIFIATDGTFRRGANLNPPGLY